MPHAWHDLCPKALPAEGATELCAPWGIPMAMILLPQIRPATRACDRPLQGCGHSRYMRIKAANVRAGLRAAQRRPVAAEVKPAIRSAAMAVLRMAAATWADVPARGRSASSFMVTSRTWCRASISQ